MTERDKGVLVDITCATHPGSFLSFSGSTTRHRERVTAQEKGDFTGEG